MSCPSNISTIAEKNLALLEEIGFDPHNDNPFELDNPNTFHETGLFTDEAIDCIFGDQVAAAPPAQEVIPPTIGMVLLRPDMVHLEEQAETFLSQRFTLLDASRVTVTPETYWRMYSDAIIGRESKHSRLTRATVYIGSECRLFTFEQPLGMPQDIPAADYTFSSLKGRQGIRQSGTLRGEVVYNGALEAGFHTLTDHETALAVDPFGAYRKIVAEESESPCQDLVHPLLFFTGVGIHIPNHQEMQRDLALLQTQIVEVEHVSR